MLPEHCRNAGIAKAERALHDLTDAAGQLGIEDKATGLLVALWNAFHVGGPQSVFRKPPIHGKREARTPTTPNPTTGRGTRCNMDRIESEEGWAAIQDVLLGRCSRRQAALKLGVHPNALGDAVHRLRDKGQRQEAEAADGPAEIPRRRRNRAATIRQRQDAAAGPAEMAQTFSLTFP